MAHVDVTKKLMKIIGIDLDLPENRYITKAIIKISSDDYPKVIIEKHILHEDEIDHTIEEFIVVPKPD